MTEGAPMTELLIHSAQILDEDKAGGHGSRWAVFDEDVSEFIDRWIAVALEDSTPVAYSRIDEAGIENLIHGGEPMGMTLLYSGKQAAGRRFGFMSLIERTTDENTGEPCNQFCSGYPFFGEGRELEAEVERVSLYPNRLEAEIQLNLASGGIVFAFDPLFWQNRALYRANEFYLFSVASMAYLIQPAPQAEHVIDDPLEIRKFRARSAWAEKYGVWSQEDEEESLAEWKPQSPEDLKPIRFDMSRMSMLVPVGKGEPGDAQFQGEVVHVEPNSVKFLEVNFWRVDVIVMRDEGDFTLPIYVAEHLFENNWRPAVGDYVVGAAWVQAYVRGKPSASH